MYQTHYHLKTQPFSEHAAATSLWLDDRMQEGLARLTHLVENATLGLITGPTGVGKSALLKRFLHELSRQQCESVYCHLTHLRSTSVLKMILSRLGEVPRRGKERLFEQILERAARAESKPQHAMSSGSTKPCSNRPPANSNWANERKLPWHTTLNHTTLNHTLVTPASRLGNDSTTSCYVACVTRFPSTH